ncbi:hypothetical protein TBR22_A02150 [Luteitalea sp. TBR-22]|uniref:SAM-dependent methyltransferase n=1 Tax=Luteitalea sp. TBR-22 TaxID=2802971 RepID=UPI001AF2044F|nr:SAM-dependent methyltransferase [Luteitalea sp. TBR-22]BCS31016.1 hypothetical protein TBR22_A02150 [Luteitalea sp. TBR-22]
MSFSHGSKSRLTDKDLGRFPSGSLFDRLARAVCRAGVLPRKELYEAWEVARRARRRFRGGRVVDLAAGHGLLAHVMLLLDDTSPRAIAVDTVVPPSAARLHDVLVEEWPRLRDRVQVVSSPLDDVSLHEDDVVVSSHACGELTDLILDRVIAAGTGVAVLPCCHDVDTCDVGPLTGWLDPALAIDVRRAARLEQAGYTVWTQTIPASITPKNRLLLASPIRMLSEP